MPREAVGPRASRARGGEERKPVLPATGLPSPCSRRHALNATELLFAMARFYRQIHATGKAGAVRVAPRSLLPALHPGKRAPGPLTRLQQWTWKPARFAPP